MDNFLEEKKRIEETKRKISEKLSRKIKDKKIKIKKTVLESYQNQIKEKNLIWN